MKRKKLLLSLFFGSLTSLVLFTLSATAATLAGVTPRMVRSYVANEVLVKYKNTQINLNDVNGPMRARNFANRFGLFIQRHLKQRNISLLKSTTGFELRSSK